MNEFPEGTAERREWWPKTRLTERTFDRHRNELVTGNYVEPTGRGVFRLTTEGRLAIAIEVPPTSHGIKAVPTAMPALSIWIGVVQVGVVAVGFAVLIR